MDRCTRYDSVMLIEKGDFLILKKSKKSLRKSLFFEVIKMLFVLGILLFVPKGKHTVLFMLGLLVFFALNLFSMCKVFREFKNSTILKFQKNTQELLIKESRYPIHQLKKIFIVENTSNVEFDVISLYIKTSSRKYLIVEMSGYRQHQLINLANHLNNYLRLTIERKNE